MKIIGLSALLLVACGARAAAQTSSPSSRWEIIDNSFLVEEAFNQEPGVFQNIFTWTRQRDDAWQAGFTQEWPAPGMKHQFSYTVPFSGSPDATGLNDVLLHYRYQLVTESATLPAISPRLSLVLPTGRQRDGLGDGVTGLQFNIPASKQFGNIYLHVNGGATWLPDVEWIQVYAGSVIWRMTRMCNLMFEATTEPGRSVTWSPGVRRGWDLRDGQIVIGAAVPITHESGRTATAALLTYFSYETRFRH